MLMEVNILKLLRTTHDETEHQENYRLFDSNSSLF